MKRKLLSLVVCLLIIVASIGIVPNSNAMKESVQPFKVGLPIAFGSVKFVNIGSARVYLDEGCWGAYFSGSVNGDPNKQYLCTVTTPSGESAVLGTVYGNGYGTPAANSYMAYAPPGTYIFQFTCWSGSSAQVTGFGTIFGP